MRHDPATDQGHFSDLRHPTSRASAGPIWGSNVAPADAPCIIVMDGYGWLVHVNPSCMMVPAFAFGNQKYLGTLCSCRMQSDAEISWLLVLTL